MWKYPSDIRVSENCIDPKSDRQTDDPILIVSFDTRRKTKKQITGVANTYKFLTRQKLSTNSSHVRGIGNNFLTPEKKSRQRRVQQCERPECYRMLFLQALAIQVDRCIARKSKMVTKTIMGFREDCARNIFRFNFRNDDVCFFVWIYEMEQFKLKVGLISNLLGGFDLFVTGRRHFLLSERSLSFNNVMITLTSARSSARTVELASVLHRCDEYLSILHTSEIINMRY